MSKRKHEEEQGPTATGPSAFASIFNWYDPSVWQHLLLKSTPVQEILRSLPDFEEADLLTFQMLKDPFNVAVQKSKHAAEGLPRPVLFGGFIQ